MASPGIVLGIPASILKLVQTGLLERAFHDTLFPALLYRMEALFEESNAHTGVQTFMSRAGQLQPVIVPIVPGQDPVPQTLTYEQWIITIQRWTGSIDTSMPTSVVSNADQFMRNIQQLGLQAGQSINRISRNALFQAYLSGQTMSTVQTATTDTSIQVASVNGFTIGRVPCVSTSSTCPFSDGPRNVSTTVSGCWLRIVRAIVRAGRSVMSSATIA